jgi:transcription elongation factor GreA
MSDAAYASLQQDLARTAARLQELGPIANAHALDGMAHSEYYLAASRRQALHALLDRAVITDQAERAALGSRVTYRQDDDEAAVTLVTHGDAAPSVGRISVTSPIGKAILGRRAGEVVTVRTPAGVRVLTVTAVA